MKVFSKCSCGGCGKILDTPTIEGEVVLCKDCAERLREQIKNAPEEGVVDFEVAFKKFAEAYVEMMEGFKR
jgi:hypothetical protein